MCLFNRLFGSQNVREPSNLITELFSESTERKIELARASLTSHFCLHEAGHVMMAELYQIPIEWVNLPRLGALISSKRPQETTDELLPAVSVPSTDSKTAVPYFLGGFFGELNIYHDVALNVPGILQVFTLGCAGDFNEIRERVKADPNATAAHRSIVVNLDRALNASRDAAEQDVFLQQFQFRGLYEFRQFRKHRDRHRSIAAQLYQRWKGQGNFERYHELTPEFGPYRY